VNAVVPATRQPPPPAIADVPLEGRHRWVALLAEVAQLAHAVANTDFVPKGMRNNEAAITAAILYGDEIGLAPMQALRSIAIIDGQPSLRAETQRAMILGAGHFIWPEEFTVTKVTWAGRRFDSINAEPTRITWTMDDARRAHLDGKPNWRSYPREMMSARSSADLARAIFADVIGGLAATEELEDLGPGEAAAAGAEPAPAPRKASSRRRRATGPSAPVIAPPPASAPEAPPEPPLPGEPGADPEPPATDAARRKLFALFNERGLTDRVEQLAFMSRNLGRPLESRNEVSDVETSRLIDALQEAAEPAPPTPPDEDREPTSSAHAPGPAAPAGQLDLAGGDEPISEDSLDHLKWLKGEAEVDDAWMRAKLAELGAPVGRAQTVTRAALKKLTKAQGNELKRALGVEIDKRNEAR
jgi:hypothetical protein